MTYLKNKKIPFMVDILILKIKNLGSKISNSLASKFYTHFKKSSIYIDKEYLHHKTLWKNAL